MTRERILGIDFGSSSTIAGVLIDGRIELVQDAGDCVIPSVVYYPDQGPPLVGRAAVARQLGEPSRVIRSVKRLLGMDSSSELVRRYVAATPLQMDLRGDRPAFKLRSGAVMPEQVAAAVLGRVRELAEQRFGGTIKRAVLTSSADAPAGYRDAVVRAARIAHLEVLDLIAEPIAASLALDLHVEPADRRILVCDFGGGTFDVSAVVQQGLRFSPVASGGDHWLGGDDLDDALARAIASVVFRTARYDMTADVVRWSELVIRCESAKRQLSTANAAPLTMREAYLDHGARRDLRLSLDRPWTDPVWEPLMRRVRDVISHQLANAGWTVDEVDVVGLVGGGALVPLFQRTVAQVLPADRIRLADQPELAVAQGATLLTARYQVCASAALPLLVA